jgi:hypothetical protein
LQSEKMAQDTINGIYNAGKKQQEGSSL